MYIGSNDGYVYALKASTGALIWRYQTGSYVTSSPTVVNGVLYIGSWDDYVYALNASTGAFIWYYQTGSSVLGSPTVVNGVVYIGSDDDYVYALNASTGALIWYYQTGNSVTSTPAVVNGVVYIGSWDDYVYALKASNGAFIWHYQTGNQIHSHPAVVNGVVYISSYDDYVYALKASTGALTWRYQTGGSVESSPTVVSGVLYIGSEDDYVYALNASNGALTWRYQTGSQVQASPTVVNGVLYIGSYDDYVYALSTSPITNNSSGYVVTGSKAYTDVKASWTQPAAQNCPIGLHTPNVAFWVGLGGLPTGNGIEQIVTVVECQQVGIPVYQVAWELWPALPQYLDPLQYPLAPGDSMNAEVSYIGNDQFTLAIDDTTQGWNFSTTQTQPQQYLDIHSAEWIVERPGADGLADFGTVTFSNCSVNGQSILYGPAIYKITMVVSRYDHTIRAQASNLNGKGTAFSVQWRHS